MSKKVTWIEIDGEWVVCKFIQFLPNGKARVEINGWDKNKQHYTKILDVLASRLRFKD